ncbi:MAG: hypothetical protein J5819_01700 [Eubacterium sp.]|nr:hypothetical protein [Eubacterium sp.]
MTEDIETIADEANVIVDGYAFKKDDSICRIIDLNNPSSAVVFLDNEVIETTMDDIELSIITDLFNKNKN